MSKKGDRKDEQSDSKEVNAILEGASMDLHLLLKKAAYLSIVWLWTPSVLYYFFGSFWMFFLMWASVSYWFFTGRNVLTLLLR